MGQVLSTGPPLPAQVTGHLQKMGSALAERKAARRSVAVLLAFGGGVAAGTAASVAAARAGGRAARWAARAGRAQFTLLALGYGLMLALHRRLLGAEPPPPTGPPPPGEGAPADACDFDAYETTCN